MEDSEKPDALADFPVVITLPVLWGDQDSFGHVNNVVSIRWFESARVAYLEQCGFEHVGAEVNIGPILAAITCHFRRQINYPDTVRIGARIASIGRSSLKMEHAVYSDAQQAIVADGDSVVVVFDYQANKSHPVPAPLREKIESLEGRSF